MTKRYLIMLADALNSTMPEAKSPEFKWVQWHKDVAAIASACQSSNPRFDRGRFIAACQKEMERCPCDSGHPERCSDVGL